MQEEGAVGGPGEVPGAFLEEVCGRMGLGPGTRLLELGCGCGAVARWFAVRGFRVDAVDVSTEAIEGAVQQLSLPLLSFHKQDAVQFMLRAFSTWDVVVAFESLHLLLQDPQVSVGLRRVLAGESCLVLGWRCMEWEAVCRAAITDVCGRYGISLADWGYWTCPGLGAVLAASGRTWREEVPIAFLAKHSSSVREVVRFLLAIDRMRLLAPDQRTVLGEELQGAIEGSSDDGWFHGRQEFHARLFRFSRSCDP